VFQLFEDGVDLDLDLLEAPVEPVLADPPPSAQDTVNYSVRIAR